MILQILYQRLSEATATEAFKLRAVRFYHLVASRNESTQDYGTDYYIKASDACQEGAFVPLYLTIILPLTQQLVRPVDRKQAAVALTKNLTQSERFAVRYQKGWTFTADALIKLLDNAPEISRVDDNIVEQDVDDLGFGVGFTQLNTCRRQPRDLYPEVRDIKVWVAQYFEQAQNAAVNGIKPLDFVRERLSPESQQKFEAYFKSR